jgi:flagellar protein FliS
MLFDTGIASLQRARAGFAVRDPAERNMTIHNNLRRAREVIQQLNIALDMDKGGELAATLGRLYDYFNRRLLESDVKKTPQGVDEVIGHFTVLRDAWAAMLRKEEVRVAPESGMVPSLATT